MGLRRCFWILWVPWVLAVTCHHIAIIYRAVKGLASLGRSFGSILSISGPKLWVRHVVRDAPMAFGFPKPSLSEARKLIAVRAILLWMLERCHAFSSWVGGSAPAKLLSACQKC